MSLSTFSATSVVSMTSLDDVDGIIKGSSAEHPETLNTMAAIAALVVVADNRRRDRTTVGVRRD
jgi:hypothetical protein